MKEQRHSACDECRSRKLRCSGEIPTCQRCQDESLSCIYSQTKKMGRPRKRKKDDQDAESTATHLEPLNPAQTAMVASDPTYALPIVAGTRDELLDPWLNMHPFPLSESTDFLCGGAADAFPHDFLPPVPAICLPNPILANTIASSTGTCNCVTILTNVLERIRPLTTFQFPLSVGHLRNSMSNLPPVVACTICPNERGTAFQNVLLLITALNSLLERFGVLLSSLDDEIERLNKSGETRELKVADAADVQHHTGGINCPAGLVVPLSGDQWGELARASIRKLVYGPGECFLSLLDDLEARQEKWHTDPHMQQLRHGRDGIYGSEPDCQQQVGCLSNIEVVRKHLGRLKI